MLHLKVACNEVYVGMWRYLVITSQYGVFCNIHRLIEKLLWLSIINKIGSFFVGLQKCKKMLKSNHKHILIRPTIFHTSIGYTFFIHSFSCKKKIPTEKYIHTSLINYSGIFTAVLVEIIIS